MQTTVLQQALKKIKQQNKKQTKTNKQTTNKRKIKWKETSELKNMKKKKIFCSIKVWFLWPNFPIYPLNWRHIFLLLMTSQHFTSQIVVHQILMFQEFWPASCSTSGPTYSPFLAQLPLRKLLQQLLLLLLQFLVYSLDPFSAHQERLTISISIVIWWIQIIHFLWKNKAVYVGLF